LTILHKIIYLGRGASLVQIIITQIEASKGQYI